MGEKIAKVKKDNLWGYINTEGKEVIPVDYYFCGEISNGIIAVGSHGCIKNNRDRSYFSSGLSYVVNSLNPKTVIVYGSAPDAIFRTYKRQGIQIVQFDSKRCENFQNS